MPAIDEQFHRRLATALALAGLAIFAIQIGMAAAGVSRSSFWIDELYTLWVASQPTSGATLHNALKDVHPPLYYLIVHFWQAVFGAGEAGLRGLSVLCAALSAIVFYFGLRQYAPPLARSTAIAVMLTSQTWVYNAQNARMYALGLLEGVLLSIVFVHAVHHLNSTGKLPLKIRLAFVALSLLYSFTHFYMFLGACALAFMLMLAMRSWKEIFGFLGIFLIVPIAMLGFIAILRQTTAVDIGHTWFSNSLGTFRNEMIWGLGATLPSNWLIVAAGFALAICILVSACRRIIADRGPLDAGLQSLLLLALTALMVGVGGIGVSVLIAPSFSARNVATVAPFIWTALCLALASIASNRLQFAGVAGAMLLASALKVDASMLQSRNEDWRAAGNFIKSQPGCAKAPLLAIIRIYEAQPPAIALSQARFHNAHYPGLEASDLMLALFDGRRFEMPPAAKALIAERLANPQGCQILAQAVHVGGLQVGKFGNLLASFRPPGSATRVVVRRFSPKTGEAFVFVAVPDHTIGN